MRNVRFNKTSCCCECADRTALSGKAVHMLTVAIPDVEISAVCLFTFIVCF